MSVETALATSQLTLTQLKALLRNPLWSSNFSGLSGRELHRAQSAALDALENNWELRHYNTTDCAVDSLGDTLVYSLDGQALRSVCTQLQKLSTSMYDLVNGVSLDGAIITLDLEAQLDEWSQQYGWTSEECDELRESLLDCESPILHDGSVC